VADGMSEAAQPTTLASASGATARLEDLDHALFGELQRDGRAAFTTLATRLGVSEAQVRRRIRSLLDADVFAIAPIANPRVLGLDQLACIGLVVRGPYMATVSERLVAMPEVSFVVVTSGEFNLIAEVGCVSSDELYEFVVELRRLPGVKSSETFVYLNVLHQRYQWTLEDDRDLSTPARGGVIERSVEIDRYDSGIIRELQRDGRASFRDIGRRLGLSERTVSNRYTRLVEERALQVIAVGNPLHLGFRAMAWLGITLGEGADLEHSAGLLAQVHGLDYVVVPSGRYDLLCELVCRNSDELLAALDHEVGAINEVAHVDTFMCLRLLYKSTAGAWGAGRSLAVNPTDRGTRRRGPTPLNDARPSRARDGRPLP
jgi:DNA-binding Lrp family transcriptional regulator